MKPLHGAITRLNRCPCCHSKYSSRGMRKTNAGKSAARFFNKTQLQKELKNMD